MAIDFSFLNSGIVPMPEAPTAQPLNMPEQGFMGKVGDFFRDPNMMQMLATMGANIGGEGSLASDIGTPTAAMYRQIQNQKAGKNILSQIFGGGEVSHTPGSNLPNTPSASSMTPKMSSDLFSPSYDMVTPKGQDGHTSVTHNITADGYTTTFKGESPNNRNSFGANTPLEAQPKQGGSEISPFFQALFGSAT